MKSKNMAVDEERVIDDPYYELANAIVKQAADDYCNAYRGWFATCETENTKSLVEVNGIYRYTEYAIRNARQDAERMIRECIRFFYSTRFSTLTKLDPTALHQRLRPKSLMTSYLRGTMKFADKPKPIMHKTKGKVFLSEHKVVSIVGELYGIGTETFTVKTTCFKSAETPNEYTYKYFTVKTPLGFNPMELHSDKPIAILGMYEKDPFKKPLEPLNIVTDLAKKQLEYEEKYLKLLREATGV